MKKIIIRRTKSYKIAFLLTNGGLNQVVFHKNNSAKAQLNDIYLGVIEEKISNLGSYIVRVGKNEKVLVRFRKSDGKENKYNHHIGKKVLLQIVREQSDGKMALGTLEITLELGIINYKTSLEFNIISKKIANNLREEISEIISDEKGFIIKSLYKYGKIELLKDTIIETKNLVDNLNKAENIGLLYRASFIENLLVKHQSFINQEIVFEDEEELKETKLIKKSILLDTKLSLYEEIKEDIEDYYNIRDYEEELFAKKIDIDDQTNIEITRTNSFNYIDINFKGSKDSYEQVKEEIAYKINNNIISEVARYIMLQDLSGQIFIDVLKVYNKQYRKILLEKLQKCLIEDSNSARVLGFSNLGLIEVNRQKYSDSTTKQLKNNFEYEGFKIILKIKEEQRKNPIIGFKIEGKEESLNIFKNKFREDLENINSRLYKAIEYEVVDSYKIELKII